MRYANCGMLGARRVCAPLRNSGGRPQGRTGCAADLPLDDRVVGPDYDLVDSWLSCRHSVGEENREQKRNVQKGLES